MSGTQYLGLTGDEYGHLLRALILYDTIRGTPADQSVAVLLERWFDEGERLGLDMSQEQREAMMAEVMEHLDDFVENEAWEEFAWRIAEREARRCSPKSRDRDSREIIAHRYYHEIMDEFNHHGVDHVAINDLKLTELSPSVVRTALEQYRSDSEGV